MNNNEFNVVNASNEVKSAVRTVKGLQDEGKKFYGDKAYDANEVYKTIVEVVVPPKKNASTKLIC